MSEQGGLNRRIAELFGWTVQRRGNSWLVSGRYGSCALHPKYNSVDEGEAWDIAFNNGLLPDYEHSLDTVTAELSENYSLDIHAIHDGRYMASIREYIENASVSPLNVIGSWYGHGATRHAAAAECLLAYAQARRGKGV